MPSQTTWPEEIRSLYLSGSANQFLLHGNVEDRVLLPAEGKEAVRFGNLFDYLIAHQLRKFDAIFSYDLGHGLRVSTPTKAGKEAYHHWPSAREARAFPKVPRDAVAYMDHFLRYCCNLRQVATAENEEPENLAGKNLSIAFVIRTASLVLPARAAQAMNYEVHSMASLVRSWSTESHFLEQNLATFLIAENLNDLHPLVAGNPRIARVAVPLPSPEELEAALKFLGEDFPKALTKFAGKESIPAKRLAGTTLSSVESLVKIRHHKKKPIDEKTLSDLRRALVEKDCQGLIDFVESDRNLDMIMGSEAVKDWMRQDIALWQQDDLRAIPMGYLLCGPVGTGKTFMVECLAGEAGIPVVKFKNFRDRWVGSTEGNLEKIFALLQALGRCIVFIDEADQALGSRSAQSGDSGVSGRVYSMMAKEMSDTRNRGKILWILASSRPDLIEVDLKRPGRVDVKFPLFPSVTPEEAYSLIRALSKRQGLTLPKEPEFSLAELIPPHLTPGSAEALAVKTYRLVKTRNLEASVALTEILLDYQSPVPKEIMDFQIEIAAKEASDLSFVPDVFRRD
tara:strand:- start:18653 stop:20353 length:1701 start_codon:yes stop_codon:yes gene_type:complete